MHAWIPSNTIYAFQALKYILEMLVYIVNMCNKLVQPYYLRPMAYMCRDNIILILMWKEIFYFTIDAEFVLFLYMNKILRVRCM